MTFTLGTLLFGVLSSAVPIFNMEVYIVAAYAKSSTGALELAAISSLGQNIGKLVWYYVAQGAFQSSWMSRRMDDPRRRARVEKWRGQVEGRPWFSGLITLVSAGIGFPPFFVIAMVAGSLRMNVVVFFLAGLIGRTFFFWVLLVGAGLLVR